MKRLSHWIGTYGQGPRTLFYYTPFYILVIFIVSFNMLLTVQQPSLSPNELSKDNAFSQVILCFDFDVIIGFMPEKHGRAVFVLHAMLLCLFTMVYKSG